MPSLTIIDTVARREDKFPLGCEIVLDIQVPGRMLLSYTLREKIIGEVIDLTYRVS